MTSKTIIVFGPTGAVGSSAARTAQQQNAKVVLAMRDPSKSIPHLDAESEKAGGFERVQADLTNPDSINAAVTKTGAKHAFIYLIFGTPDNMRSTIDALKKSGIEFVVFLSSVSVKGDPKDTESSDYIAYAHAQVEINLAEVFGSKGYVALRPAFFASNSLMWKYAVNEGEAKKYGVEEGEAKLLDPEVEWDYIVPEDIGRVAGRIAAGGFEVADGNNAIRLLGAQLMSQRNAIGVIGRALGKEVKISQIGEQAALEQFMKFGRSEQVAKDLVKLELDAASGHNAIVKDYEKDAGNVLKYGGNKATTFEEWVAENKQLFEN